MYGQAQRPPAPHPIQVPKKLTLLPGNKSIDVVARQGCAASICLAMSASTPISFAARESKHAIEEGMLFAPKFDEHGLMPAMAVDADSGAPLMLAYMNEQSLKMTLELGQAVYWSRSRNQLWHKGATSGEFQEIIEIRTDCDQDALVLRVKQHGGGCCHTKRPTCFYRLVKAADGEALLEAAE